MRLLATVIAATCLVGCSDDSDTGTDPILADGGASDAGLPEPAADGGTTMKTCEGMSMELGTGVRSFQGVVDGDTVYLYRGPQGGFMIYLSVRAAGLDPSDVTLCYTEKFATTGTQFGKGCWKIMLTNDLGDGRHERVGVWGQIDAAYWTKAGSVRGSNARVDVTLTDRDGCSTKAGWSVHISDDPGV